MKVTNYQWEALQDIARDTYDDVEVSTNRFAIITPNWDVKFMYVDGEVVVVEATNMESQLILEDLIEGAKDTGEWYGPEGL